MFVVQMFLVLSTQVYTCGMILVKGNLTTSLHTLTGTKKNPMINIMIDSHLRGVMERTVCKSTTGMVS